MKQAVRNQQEAGRVGNAIREEFPLFSDATVAPAYLDSAASSQKPRSVITRISEYLAHEHANIHRGAYALSGQATARYEEARQKVASFINAPQPDEIVFTRGTTESINLVAYAAEHLFNPGDTILLSVLEHHSNIVPWQMLAERKKLRLEYADILPTGELDIEDFKRKVQASGPKLVAITAISNALGTVVPLKEIVPAARAAGALVLIDAAQAVPHACVDVQELDADFLAFSGHKMYGPTGIGILYARSALLARMKPFMGGGDMIEQVALEGSTWAAPPQKFEAGTPPIAEAIALGTAIDFMKSIGVDVIANHEQLLLETAVDRLSAVPGVQLYGPITAGKPQASILSFTVDGIHPHDLSTVADSHNVQLRAGHHCAMPLLKRLGLPSTARISFGVYNITEDIESLVAAIKAAQKIFG